MNDTPETSQTQSDSSEIKPKSPRSRIWLLPCGCVGIILLLAGGAAGFLWMNARTVRATEAYQVAVAEALQQPLIQDKLGKTLTATGWAGGRVNPAAGTAEIGFVLEGHRGGGKIRAKLEQTEGIWTVKSMDFQVSGQENRYILIPPASPTDRLQSVP